MNTETKELVSKVPHVTLIFWIVKIFATTLGETGGDALSMSLDLGYLVSTGIFALIFVAAVAVQIKASKFHPALYWLTIVATTTVGTTMADYATRDLGIGYTGGSAILLTFVLLSLLVWRLVMGTVSVESVNTPKVEIFYWVTIMFSQTLGTALGDWFADSLDLGYLAAAAVFGAALLLTYLLYRFTSISRASLFWVAFILTRPLGAVVGDFLDKPLDHGGLALSRFTASAVLLVLIVAFIYTFPQRPAEKAH
ncbi:MAG TPA: hypothetical protein PKC65_02305 [Pyrinomonadaceae bacterium]|nr:hypothetical protein [Acidobacteriota bacterium]HMM78833.1 hypothetical protein [Pyrinomonadaceae bacterium]